MGRFELGNVGYRTGVGFLDLATEFDAAIEWALDDPLLADHEPSSFAALGWPTSTDDGSRAR